MERLTSAQSELRARAARFVDEVLVPLELEAELNGGRLPAETIADIRRRAGEARLVGGNHAVEVGGQGWSAFEQVLVQEELGRNTNGVWWNMGGGYNVLARATPEQIERYLKPTLRGERADAYAVTEAGAGSDAARVAGTAERTASGWRIRAEKWFVTSGDVSDFDIVMVNVVEGDERLPTLFLVDRDRPGIDVVDDPPFTHTYPHGHPTVRYDCEVGADAVHGRAAMAKLFASEAAWRCADRCVQVLGGRGYMRTTAAERFLRELRVDRIWEGTSEIQRLIIARGLERRGVERMLDVQG